MHCLFNDALLYQVTADCVFQNKKTTNFDSWWFRK